MRLKSFVRVAGERQPRILTCAFITSALVWSAAADCTYTFRTYCPSPTCAPPGRATSFTLGPYSSEAACERARAAGRPGAGVTVGPCVRQGVCVQTPLESGRHEDSRGLSVTPLQPSDDAEAREKALADERDRVAAEERRRKDEKFQRDKAEVLQTMKGVSSGETGLKGISGQSTSNAGVTVELKGFDTTPRGPGLAQADLIYWKTVAGAVPVPAACLEEKHLTSGDACIVVQVGELVMALKGPDPVHAIAKLLLEKGGKKVIAISLGDVTLDAKLGLVEKMYEAERDEFDFLAQWILREMVADPVKQAWLTNQVKLDSAAVTKLRNQIFAEEAANVQASKDYLKQNAASPGIRFICSSACSQLTQAARGIGGLEYGRAGQP